MVNVTTILDVVICHKCMFASHRNDQASSPHHTHMWNPARLAYFVDAWIRSECWMEDNSDCIKGLQNGQFD